MSTWKPLPLHTDPDDPFLRVSTQYPGLDRALNGGFYRRALTVVTDPDIAWSACLGQAQTTPGSVLILTLDDRITPASLAEQIARSHPDSLHPDNDPMVILEPYEFHVGKASTHEEAAALVRDAAWHTPEPRLILIHDPQTADPYDRSDASITIQMATDNVTAAVVWLVPGPKDPKRSYHQDEFAKTTPLRWLAHSIILGNPHNAEEAYVSPSPRASFQRVEIERHSQTPNPSPTDADWEEPEEED